MADSTKSGIWGSEDVSIEASRGVLTATLLIPSIGADKATGIHAEVGTALDKATAGAGFRALVIDVSRVTFMNSMGVGMCVDLRNRSEQAGGQTILVGLNDQLHSMFKLVKIDTLFRLVKDEKELQKAIG